MEHSIDIRVYYEDTDAAGIVYYANYLKFAERGRTELLRESGLGNKSLADAKGIVFAVRHIKADYIKPAFLDNLLTLTTSVTRLKNASIDMKQILTRDEALIFTLDVTLACLDSKTFRPARLPPEIKYAFNPDTQHGVI